MTPRILDDVEQRVALNLWRRISREQNIHHPASYLYRAAVRETVHVIREEQRREEETRSAGNAPEPEGPASPAELLEAKRLGGEIMKVLKTLQPKRERAVRAHLAGFSVAEIMRMYDWSYNTARNLIARGMGDLRAGLRERGIDG